MHVKSVLNVRARQCGRSCLAVDVWWI